MAHFTDTERLAFATALSDTFRRDELRRVLSLDLDQEYDHLVTVEGYAEQVNEIVSRAEERNWSLDLLSAVVKRHPRVEVFVGLQSAKGPVKVGGWESIVRKGDFVNMAAFTEWMMLVGRTVCSIKVNSFEGAIGTGFLVGPDLLLTNHHVVAEAIETPEQVPEIALLFDFAARDRGNIYTFPTDQLTFVAYSPPASEEAEEKELNAGWDATLLDYALIRLPEPVGDLPYRTRYGELPMRGWLTLAPPEQGLKMGDILRITQHPLGKEMVLAVGPALGLDAGKIRVRYQANTDRGSSGAPVFNEHMELVALHHRGNWAGTENQGIPITAIITDLVGKGVEVPAAPPDEAFVWEQAAAATATEVADVTEVLYNQPFIGRAGLKQYVSKLLGGERIPHVLLLNGRSRVGRSYLSHYFDRLAAAGHFRLINIDFRGRADLHPAELARQLAISLQLTGYHTADPTDRFEDFKQQIFLSQVENHLLTSEHRYLFFLDHCHEARLSRRVRDLIVGLANLIAQERIPGIFAGVGIDREDQLHITGQKPNISNFAKEDVHGYFKYLYKKLAPDNTEAEFLSFAMSKIPDRLFEDGAEVNVEEIGRRARIIADTVRESLVADSPTHSTTSNLNW